MGTHETLLAYLVRRLLENGANTSFVNRVADHSLPLTQLVQDPVVQVDTWAAAEGAIGWPHPGIPLPAALYGADRPNAQGWDLHNEHTLDRLAAALRQSATEQPLAGPLLDTDQADNATLGGPATAVRNPAWHGDTVGWVRDATPAEVDHAATRAAQQAPLWAATPPQIRAERLRAAAHRLEADTPALIGLLIREAGKTAGNAVAEVREAVDFLRYYAQQVERHFDHHTHIPLGPVVCISPWNFPLAIFVGQVSAALAAGNTVLAKPAEATPLIAARAVQALWAAGVPRHALQLLTGPGSVVGEQLVKHPLVQGVLFTGSTGVARRLQRNLVGRVTPAGTAVPLIAETGGQNAMIVDSSALPEQVVADVITSAFDSAGQRCSALRVLCVQAEAADRLLDMLLGAMAELRVGNPGELSTDVGPVIDARAQQSIEQHIANMRTQGHRVHRLQHRGAQAAHPLNACTFVLPTVVEIDSIASLTHEVFGPVLHVLRFQREQLPALLQQINATGYGLTMGVHTRIDETAEQVARTTNAGNLYVNRNMVGAVVGVQPFGGEGLSGTGPKAGGPLYLYRLLSQQPPQGWTGSVDLCGTTLSTGHQPTPAWTALQTWVQTHSPSLVDALNRLATDTRTGTALQLPGPTGERNTYQLAPKAHVLCLADQASDRLLQLAAVLASGGHAVWPQDAEATYQALPVAVRVQITLVPDWTAAAVALDAVLLHGSTSELARVQDLLAQRPGPVIAVERMAPGQTTLPLERLLVERATSTNTAAAGGNASLMTLDAG